MNALKISCSLFNPKLETVSNLFNCLTEIVHKVMLFNTFLFHLNSENQFQPFIINK